MNAQYVKHVSGRKTDMMDSEWLAELMLHGLLKPGFIPPEPVLAGYSHPLDNSPFKMSNSFGLFMLISGTLTGWHYSDRTSIFPGNDKQ